MIDRRCTAHPDRQAEAFCQIAEYAPFYRYREDGSSTMRMVTGVNLLCRECATDLVDDGGLVLPLSLLWTPVPTAGKP